MYANQELNSRIPLVSISTLIGAQEMHARVGVRTVAMNIGDKPTLLVGHE